MPDEPSSTDLSSLPQVDQEAIGATLLNLMAGFQERNVDKLADIYSSDADWVNAFGTVKKGSDGILDYLRGLFADDNFNAGTLRAPPEIAIRVSSRDVVLVSAHLQVKAKASWVEESSEERDNFSLRVLQRQADGTWPIVSEMFNDANRKRPTAPTRSRNHQTGSVAPARSAAQHQNGRTAERHGVRTQKTSVRRLLRSYPFWVTPTPPGQTTKPLRPGTPREAPAAPP